MVQLVDAGWCRWRALAAALAVAALVLAGCGSTAATLSAAPSAPKSGAVSGAVAAATAAPPATMPTAVAPTTTGATAVPATGAATSTAFDSCSIVTQAEAASALGHSVRPPLRGKATVEGGLACVFYGPGAPAGVSPDIPVPDSVRVVLVVGPDARTFFNDYRSKVLAQAISGLGDQAFFDGAASLSVLKGDEYLRVAVIGVRDVLAAEQGLARAVLPRM